MPQPNSPRGARPKAELERRLDALTRQEAIRQEGEDLTRMIGDAEGSYNALVSAAEAFDKAILALRSRSWLDPQHGGRANDVVFRITSRIKGMNFA